MSPTTPKTPPDTKSVHSMEPIGNIVPQNRTEAAIAACKYELAVEAILLDIEIDEAIRAIDEEIEKGKEILLTDPSSETAKALARSVIRKIIELEHRPLTWPEHLRLLNLTKKHHLAFPETEESGKDDNAD